jgi:hypothetical protein
VPKVGEHHVVVACRHFVVEGDRALLVGHGVGQQFRNLSHLSLPMRTGFGATCCQAAVTVLSGSEPGPSSQFSDDHLPEGMNLSSPCAFARASPWPVPAPLAVPVLVTGSTREARLAAALA